MASINDKLKDKLPVEFFVCMALVSLSPDRTEARIWNAGMPEIVVYRIDDGDISDLIRPTLLPMGINYSSALNMEPVVVKLQHGDRIYVYSDGITESENDEGELFGQERFNNSIIDEKDPEKIFYSILRAVELFTNYSNQSDDLTLLEITGGATS